MPPTLFVTPPMSGMHLPKDPAWIARRRVPLVRFLPWEDPLRYGTLHGMGFDVRTPSLQGLQVLSLALTSILLPLDYGLNPGVISTVSTLFGGGSSLVSISTVPMWLIGMLGMIIGVFFAQVARLARQLIATRSQGILFALATLVAGIIVHAWLLTPNDQGVSNAGAVAEFWGLLLVLSPAILLGFGLLQHNYPSLMLGVFLLIVVGLFTPKGVEQLPSLIVFAIVMVAYLEVTATSLRYSDMADEINEGTEARMAQKNLESLQALLARYLTDLGTILLVLGTILAGVLLWVQYLPSMGSPWFSQSLESRSVLAVLPPLAAVVVVLGTYRLVRRIQWRKAATLLRERLAQNLYRSDVERRSDAPTGRRRARTLKGTTHRRGSADASGASARQDRQDEELFGEVATIRESADGESIAIGLTRSRRSAGRPSFVDADEGGDATVTKGADEELLEVPPAPGASQGAQPVDLQAWIDPWEAPRWETTEDPMDEPIDLDSESEPEADDGKRSRHRA